ncbi:hypothetical protein ACODM8_13090 [Vibrio ostreicida]|uniref:hypothetical protein n=1 Tax=Vibrio ostreicida TaxID=526588 RepID=UPI003B5B64C6
MDKSVVISSGRKLDISKSVAYEDEIDSFEKLVKSAEPIKGAAGGAEQYENDGDADDAFRDFRDATDRETEKDISQRGRNQKIAKDKKDGKTVTYREKSRGDGDYDGASIVEKQNSSGKQTKVRYNKKESD